MNDTGRISIAAVVVTHNRLEKLKRSIDCILPQKVHAIFVVDNASTDGTADWLKNFNDERLRICSLEENIGGAGGFYAGIKLAIESTECDWVCCFDDDAYADNSLIDTFRDKHGRCDAAFVASAVYAADSGEILEMNRPVSRLPSGPIEFMDSILRRRNFVVNNESYLQNTTIGIEAASMVGLFINAAKAKGGVGLPKPELFLYCDDLIYTSSARLSGETLLFDPQLKFCHDCVDDSVRLYNPSWKAYLLTRNYIEFYRQIAPGSCRLMILVRIIYILSNLKYSNDKQNYLKFVYRGIKDGFTGVPSINIADIVDFHQLRSS